MRYSVFPPDTVLNVQNSPFLYLSVLFVSIPFLSDILCFEFDLRGHGCGWNKEFRNHTLLCCSQILHKIADMANAKLGIAIEKKQNKLYCKRRAGVGSPMVNIM